MPDFDERLAMLDEIEAPDLWKEIEARTQAEPSAPDRPERRLPPRLFALAGAAVGLTVALVVVLTTVVLVRPSGASALEVIQLARKDYEHVPPFRLEVVRRRKRVPDLVYVHAISYGGPKAWRVDVLKGTFFPPGNGQAAGGEAGAFEVWNGRLSGTYLPRARQFWVGPAKEWLDTPDTSWFDPSFDAWSGGGKRPTPPDFFKENCDVRPSARIAGRPARHLSCSDATGQPIDVWLDAGYGLILKLVATDQVLEVRRVRFNPSFPRGNFTVVPPRGAKAIWSGDGPAPPQYQAKNVSRLVSTTIRLGVRPGDVKVGEGAVWVSAIVCVPRERRRSVCHGMLIRIDPRTNRVVARIPVAGSELAVGEGVVWIGGSGDAGTVTRIDARTNRLIGRRVKVGSFPGSVAVGEGSAWFMSGTARTVKFERSRTEYGSVARLDPRTGRVVATVPIGGEAWPGGVAVGAGGVWATGIHRDPRDSSGRHRPKTFFLGQESVYAFRARPRLFRIDPRTNRVSAEIDLGGHYHAFGAPAVGPGAVWLPVIEDQPGGGPFAGRRMLLRIDPRTNMVVARIRIEATGVAVGAGYVWVANQENDTVIRIDPRTNRIVGRPIKVGGGPVRVALGEGAAWVTNNRDGTVARIDLRDLP